MKTESVTSDANWMTRRSFLRAIGATALASVVTSIPLSFAPSLIPSVASSAGDEQDVHKALEIATASSVFSQAIEELSKLGFEFVPGKSDFLRSSDKPHLGGLAMSDTRPDPKKEGAHIVVTVDLEEHALVAVNYTIGKSMAAGLDITRVRLAPSQAREERHEFFLRDDATVYRSTPVDALIVATTASASSDSASLPADQTTAPESWTECTDWYFSSCCGISWCTCCYGILGCVSDFRCVCSREYRNCRVCYASQVCGSWYSEWRNRNHGCIC